MKEETMTLMAATDDVETAPPAATGAGGHDAAQAKSLQVTVIEPVQPWELFGLGELWRCRELVFFLVWRDVKVRYKQTVLGAAWAIIQPVSMMIVFTVVFNRIAGVQGGKWPYPVFSFAATVPWTFFAAAISTAGNSVVGSEKLITKIYFPRLSIPLAAVGATVVDFVIAFVLLVGLMAWYRVPPTPAMLMLPVIFGLILMLATGVGTMLGGLNVNYRDFRYVIPFMVQMWMYATPTIYMETSGGSSPWARALLVINPMTPLIAAFRTACLGGTFDWQQIGISAAVTVVVLVMGCLVFRRIEHTFADRI